MVFSSDLFVFLFLPLILLGNGILSGKLRNLWLLFASLFFYAWGEGIYLLVMIVSITFNYVMGLFVASRVNRSGIRWITGGAVCGNLALLGFFKYGNFLAENWNAFAEPYGIPALDLDPVHLPIGISFFTFQAMSYVLDVRSQKVEVQKNPLRLALYVSLFPQLIAGPIVRYRDVARDIASRHVRREDLATGAWRFTVGLAKKMLLANVFAIPADLVFQSPVQEMTPAAVWVGVFAYTLQIYFDFSGYSDMAIGIGRMLGFHFLENFNYPYIASSVTDFWRRWHISLSTWFRDYLYIPLGGNRGGMFKTGRNLVVVFFLCGLWHGASWNFVVWGLFHGGFLVLERLLKGPGPAKMGWGLGHAWTLAVVCIGWVLFRAETLSHAMLVMGTMFGAGDAIPILNAQQLITGELVFALCIGLPATTPVFPWIQSWASRTWNTAIGTQWQFTMARCILMTILLFVCGLKLAADTHNPFIYFRF
jgi:alginate O-acetyltransferase complex protein AlgI